MTARLAGRGHELFAACFPAAVDSEYAEASRVEVMITRWKAPGETSLLSWKASGLSEGPILFWFICVHF